jgi:hypothetical protein
LHTQVPCPEVDTRTAVECCHTSVMMATTFTVPIVSTVDSSQYAHGHSHTRSHQRSSGRLTRPFVLPRIPSERLDPKSSSYDHDSVAYESSHKCAEHDNTNGTSLASNGSITAPSLHRDGHIKGISKPAGATTCRPTEVDTFHSQGCASSPVGARTQLSAAKMDSKSR